MKKTIPIAVLVLLTAAAFGFVILRLQPAAPALTGSQTDSAVPGSLLSGLDASKQGNQLRRAASPAVEANGVVRSNQSALLTWQTSGTVSAVEVAAGNLVVRGQELAFLATASLPQQVILAQADLVEARKSLADLQSSKLSQALALKAVEDAQKALEDLQNPQVSLAQAGEAVAAAQKALDQANLQVYTLTAPPAPSAIDEAYASMLLAENKLNNTRKQLERLQNQLKKVGMLPPSFRAMFRRILKRGIENLEFQLNRDQMAYDRQVDQYNNLLEPADPTDLAVAQADLEKAQALLDNARRLWERLKDGPSQAEISVAEARLNDARREWERLKGGPDPADIAAAEAQVAAAEAALSQAYITAPFDGVITQAASLPGDLVQPGALAFRLDDLSRLLVDAQVSEIDINRVHSGQSAVLTFDGTPANEYHGQVVEVAPVSTEAEGVVYFAATIEIEDADPAVRPGMTASVEILLDSAEDGTSSQ
jgi:HlyD family secretion protein